MMKKAESQGLSFRSEVDLDGDGGTGKIAEFLMPHSQLLSAQTAYVVLHAKNALLGLGILNVQL